MQLLNTLLIVGASALAVPVITVERAEINATTQLRDYQSSLLAWQLAGTTNNDDDLCDDLDNLDGSGLNVGTIKNILCSPSEPQNTTTALPKIYNLTTSIFETLITNSFPPTTYPYLCQNLDHALLASFNISDNVIIDSVCQSAMTAPSPSPFTGPETNATATQAFVEAGSRLFAVEWAAIAGLGTTPDVGVFGLEGDVVKQTMESFAGDVPCYVEVEEAMRKGWSEMFGTLIGSVSQSTGWKKWLEQNLDIDAMDALGLDGEAVRGRFC